MKVFLKSSEHEGEMKDITKNGATIFNNDWFYSKRHLKEDESKVR